MAVPLDPLALAAYHAYWKDRLRPSSIKPFGKLSPEGRQVWTRVVKAVLEAKEKKG